MSFQTGIYGPSIPPPSDLFPMLTRKSPLALSLTPPASNQPTRELLREPLQDIAPANDFTTSHQHQAFPNWPRSQYLAGLGESIRLPLDHCVYDKSKKASAEWLTWCYGEQLPVVKLAPGAQQIGKGTLYAVARRAQVRHQHLAVSLRITSVAQEDHNVLINDDCEDDCLFGSMEGVGGEGSRRGRTEQQVSDDAPEYNTACPADDAEMSPTDDLFAGFSGVQEAAWQGPEPCTRQLYLLNDQVVAGHQVLENREAYWNKVEGRMLDRDQVATGQFPRVEVRPAKMEGLITAQREQIAAKTTSRIVIFVEGPHSADQSHEDAKKNVLVYPRSPALKSAFDWDDSDDESDEEDKTECGEEEGAATEDDIEIWRIWN